MTNLRELKLDADTLKYLAELTRKRNAVILAHNYQRPEVQDVGDFVGDSLDLSRRAAETKADVIVFCGVHFMAETAAILCPRKTVLMPDVNAGCPMANMLTVRELRAMKAAHPAAVVVTYVNSSAAVKAESDICCTSANAVRVVDSIPRNKEIIFVPDRWLGDYVSKQLKRPLIFANGYCPTHQRILPEFIERARKEHPGAKVIVHPECTAEVIAMADAVGSTSQILKYCKESEAKEFIIGTETGILHRLGKESPGKRFYAASPVSDCPNMKLTTVEKIIWSLEDMETRITVEPEVAARARGAIDRMLAVSGQTVSKK
jgi:quinolinate synthase